MAVTVHFDCDEAARYVGDALHIPVDLRWHNAIGVRRDGELIAGVLYTDYNRHSVAAHIAAHDRRWITKDVLWSIFYWPFTVLGVRVIFGYVAESNTHALALDLKLGFKEHARVPDVFEDGDLLILSMYKQDCKHLDIPFRSLSHGWQSA